MENMIEVKNLTKRYGGILALNKLNLSIKKGETIGLLGHNGAGKSTFVSLLTGTTKPTDGDIFINNISIKTRFNDVKKIIGYVPQDIALYSMLSGIDNLNFWAEIYGLKGSTKKERIKEVILTVRLEEKITQKVETYSGGMKRRLNIAVALLHYPEILILDEPTVGIDIHSKRYIFEAIKNLKKNNRTIVLVSHYIDDMEILCDKIAILKKGEMEACGTQSELLKHYNKESLEEILLEFNGG